MAISNKMAWVCQPQASVSKGALAGFDRLSHFFEGNFVSREKREGKGGNRREGVRLGGEVRVLSLFFACHSLPFCNTKPIKWFSECLLASEMTECNSWWMTIAGKLTSHSFPSPSPFFSLLFLWLLGKNLGERGFLSFKTFDVVLNPLVLCFGSSVWNEVIGGQTIPLGPCVLLMAVGAMNLRYQQSWPSSGAIAHVAELQWSTYNWRW